MNTIYTSQHDLTVIIPAYNEAPHIKDTIISLQSQTTPPKEIIVVDDGSTDNTGEVAKKLGVTVARPTVNTGSKAGAQNYVLPKIKTELTMALDADTTLKEDAIEILIEAFDNNRVAAACGFVLPRFVNTVWERGRYIEYLLAFTFYKPVQDHIGKPLISSGCFSMYRTKFLKEHGGWPTRTMAEDMDLTWTVHKKDFIVRFIPDAVSYPIEPHNFHFMKTQLTRWSHGFVQNVALHYRDVLRIPYLNHIVAVSTWDSLMGGILYIILLPFLTIYFKNPLFLLGYVIDLPIILVPVLYKSLQRKEGLRAFISFPSFAFLRIVNSWFILEAYWSEWVMGKRLSIYKKGH